MRLTNSLKPAHRATSGGGGAKLSLNVCKRLGFTLAEVLITLGIIGVVAAITIPGLVTSYQKIMAVNRLKHTYAILSQAIQLQKAETGMDILEFDTLLEPKEFMKKYINPYLKVIGECTTQAQCYGNRSIIGLDR